jgi:energy-coupling factor transporter ATP-binding protein EcfA2
LIETWSNQAFDDTFQPIQEFEIHCARERDLVLAQQSGDHGRVLEVLESEYRRRVADRFGSVELRGIQLNHRVILDLDQVFLPLHFVDLSLTEADEKGQILLSEPGRRMSIGEIIKKDNRILLIGSPGSGKSTLVSFLASRCAVGNHGLSWPARALPFVITVRELKDAELSPEWIGAQAGIASEVVLAALAEDRVVLLVDGLDEAPEQLRADLEAAVCRFGNKYPGTPVVVTSRPAGGPGEIESSLPGFGGFRLADLMTAEVNEFIDKWCLAAEKSARPNSSEAHKEASAAAADLKSRIARSRPVQRISVNTLLTTILCVVHRFLGRTIPEHRVTLYEKCTDALLYEWDRAKFPKGAAVGNLDANQKRALLRGVASALHEKHEAEIPEAEVVRHFAMMLPQVGKPAEEALRIVREIRDRSGLLVERRPGAFAFSHLTFQEYLTALDYAPRWEQLLPRLSDPWWNEVVALAVGIPGCDPAAIIRSLLGKKNRQCVILAAKCLETAINVPIDVRKEAENAIEQILPPRDFRDVSTLSEVGLTVAPILARGLLKYDSSGKGWSLDVFNSFEYEPVVPLLVQLASDKGPAPFSVALDKNRHFQPTVGEWAIFVLGNMARTSESAKRALVTALAGPVSKELLELIGPELVLGDEFKPSRQGRPSSRRAKSTA